MEKASPVNIASMYKLKVYTYITLLYVTFNANGKGLARFIHLHFVRELLPDLKSCSPDLKSCSLLP